MTARKPIEELDPINRALREAEQQQAIEQELEERDMRQEKIRDKLKSSQVSDLNAIEQALRPANIGQDGDPYLEMLAAREQEKMELAREFLTGGLQKTEVSQSERKLIPLMFIMANNPFNLPVTEDNDHKHKELEAFLVDYLKFGIPLGRKGRNEEVEIMKSLFGQEQHIEADQSIKDKFLRR